MNPRDSELYTPARYLAVLSVIDYQEKADIADINFYAHADISLRPEAESLENLGFLDEDDGLYCPKDKYREDIAELGEFVQVERNGKWEDIEISDEDQEIIEEERTELIAWIT